VRQIDGFLQTRRVAADKGERKTDTRWPPIEHDIKAKRYIVAWPYRTR